MRILALPALGLATLVVACAPISESECLTGNWAAIGFADGKAGRTANRFGTYVEECRQYGVRPDQSAYALGRSEGLAQYCTPANAYKIGRRGKEVSRVCTPSQLKEMQAAYLTGSLWFKTNEQIEELEERRSDLKSELAALPDVMDDTQTARASDIRRELRKIDHRIFSLTVERRRYEA